MKKMFFSMMLAALSLTSFAQQPQEGRQRREFNPEEMATRRADRLKEVAQLSDEQYQKVYDLYLQQSKDQQARIKEAQDRGERPQFNRDEMQKQQEATNAAMKEILSDEQFEAYTKLQQQRRGGRPGGQMGGQRGRRGGPQGMPQGERLERPQD